MIEGEEWRQIDVAPRYSVSDHGRVYDYELGRIVKQRYDRAGYLRVHLWINGIRKTVSVHRLVGFSFLDLTDDFEINHLDGDKSYNYVGNLEVTTRSKNMKHAYENFLIDIPGRTSIICVELNKEYRSIREAARDLGISCHKSISRVLDNSNKQTHGFHFVSKEVMP